MKLDNFTPIPLDLRGWHGADLIFSHLINKINPSVILEIGTWKGQSAITMARAIKAQHRQATIYCIDTWLGSLEFRENEKQFGDDWNRMLLHGYPQVYYQFISNCVHTGVIDMIEPVPATSRDAVNFVPNADLIYIDGDHTYQGVKEDINNYWPKLKEGGIMFGDDYFLIMQKRHEDNFKADVKTAVDEFAKEHNLTVEILLNNFWIIRKI